MPFPMTAPGFPAPVYTASAPGQAFPLHLGLAPNASSHLRVAAATRSQVPMGSHEGRQAAPQGPTATRQQLQVAMVPMHAQPGVPPPGAQPQQAALVPLQSQPPGPSQVDAQHQQQAAVVPVQAQAQGPSHVEQQQRIDHAAVQGPSQGARQTQQAGAAQPSGAQGLEQGSAQPTAQPTHQDRTGQAPVQASCPQQVRAAGACAVLSPGAPFGGHQHSAGQGQAQQLRAATPPAVQVPASAFAAAHRHQVCQGSRTHAWPYPARFAPRIHVTGPLHEPSISRQLAISLQALTSGQLELTLAFSCKP